MSVLNSGLSGILGFILLCPVLAAEGYERQSSGSLGLESAYDRKGDEFSHNQLALEQNHLWLLASDAEAAKFRFSLRLMIDAEKENSYQKPGERNIEKLLAYVEKSIDDFKLSFGYQEVQWGENLLLPILDVVNPRNLESIRGYYDPNAKLASPMLRVEWARDNWDAEGIVVPLPTKSRQPLAVGDYGLEDQRRYEMGPDSEYGMRLGTLRDGINTKIYFFRHHPREPSYRFRAFDGVQSITIEEEMVDTSGLSLSYADYSWLLRLDLADHRNFPATSIAPKVERSRLEQGILGLTWTSDAQDSIGVEWHNDYWQDLPDVYAPGAWVERKEAQSYLSWLGLTANLSFNNARYEPQIFFLKGLNNNDSLLRVIAPMNLDDAMTFALEYQRTHAETTSPKVLLSQTESLSWRLTYAF